MTGDDTSNKQTFKRDKSKPIASSGPIEGGSGDDLWQHTVGDVVVTAISDGRFDLPGAFFSDGQDGTVAAGANIWRLDAGDRVYMVDAGSGQQLMERFPETGQAPMVYEMKALDPGVVTDVIITHMHADHIGGLMWKDLHMFGSVSIHVAETEWAFWTDPKLPDAVPAEMRPMVEQIQMMAAKFADMVTTHAGPVDLGNGVSMIPAPGHTPGHSAVEVASGSDRFMILADAVIAEKQFAEPGITYALDGDPAQAAATRRTLLTELADSGTMFAATHLAYPGAGRVQKDGDGFRFIPV